MTKAAVPSPDGTKTSGGDGTMYRWRIVLLQLFGVVVVLVVTPFWPWVSSLRNGSRVSDEAQDPPREWFSSRAFSTQANSDDLKQEALRTAEELLQAYPDRTESLAVMARLHYSLGNSDAAKEKWLRCCAIDPSFANAYFALGVIAKDEGDFSQAEQMFRKVAELAPEDPYTPPQLGEVLIASGRVEEAVVVLDKHVHTQVVLPDAVVKLGQAYVQLKDYEQAKRTLEAGIRSFPDDPRVYYALGRLYAKLGEHEKSRQYMDQFASHAPLDHEKLVQENLQYDDLLWVQNLLVKTLWETGQAYRRFQRREKAEEMWRKASQLDSKHVACRRELVTLYEEQQRYFMALKFSEELCQLEPQNPEHWLNRGLLNARLDRLDAALANIGQAIRLDPKNPKYRQAYKLGRRGK